jgi:hypothetical protein
MGFHRVRKGAHKPLRRVFISTHRRETGKVVTLSYRMPKSILKITVISVGHQPEKSFCHAWTPLPHRLYTTKNSTIEEFGLQSLPVTPYRITNAQAAFTVGIANLVNCVR